MLGLVESISCLIVGVILYVIGKYVPIEPLVNKILWIIGLIMIIIGLGFLVYNIIVLYVLVIGPICGLVEIVPPNLAAGNYPYFCHST